MGGLIIIILIMLMKRCWRCPQDTEPKPLDEFCRGGKDSVCKKCRYELNSEWSKSNKEKLRPKRAEYMKAYRAAKKAQQTAEENTSSTESGGSELTKT